MEKRIVAIVRFERPLESVRRAVDLSHGLDHLPARQTSLLNPTLSFGHAPHLSQNGEW